MKLKKCNAVEPEFKWKCILDDHPIEHPGPGYHRDKAGNSWYDRAREFTRRQRKYKNHKTY